MQWNKRDRYGRIVGKVLVVEAPCKAGDCPKTVDACLSQITAGLAWWYRDYARALRELGLLYAKGLGVTEDAAEAQRLMARSAAQGDKEAQEWLDTNCPQKPEWLQKLVGENS